MISFSRFRKFGGLTSGVGVHYEPSIVTSATTHSTELVVGERLPPQILLYAADYRPIEIQLLCPSNTRFKVFVFCGNLAVDFRALCLQKLADNLCGSGGLMKKVPEGAVEVFVVMKGKKETADYMDVPKVLRPTWDRSVCLTVCLRALLRIGTNGRYLGFMIVICLEIGFF